MGKRLLQRATVIGLMLILFCMLPSLTAHAMTEDGKIVIVVDPGHGGFNAGAVNGKTYESHSALKVGLMVRDILEAHGGFEVHMTRDTDIYLNRRERAEIADSVNADFCLSLHFNGNDNKSVGGASVLISVKKKYQILELSNQIVDSLSEQLGIRNGGLVARVDFGKATNYWSEEHVWDIPNAKALKQKTDYYGLMNWCSRMGMPSIIVEHCYMSNSKEIALIRSEEKLRLMAQIDAQAIIDWYTGHTHEFGEVEVDYPTSCVYAGKESRHCKICGCRSEVKALADAPDPDKHLFYLTEETKATCYKTGTRVYTCAYAEGMVKGDADIELHTKTETIKKTKHTFRLQQTVEPTHGMDGYELRVCKNCNDEEKTVLPTNDPHVYIEASRTEPTCTAEGSILYQCTGCTDENTEPIPPSGIHAFVLSETCEAGCETEGEEIYVCTGCEITDRRVLSPLGHDVADGACTRCGKEIEVTGTETQVVTEPPDDTDQGTESSPHATDTVIGSNTDELGGEEEMSQSMISVFVAALIVASSGVLAYFGYRKKVGAGS